MTINKNLKKSKKLFGVIVSGFLLMSIFTVQSARAGFDYIYFSINGDTTISTMTQGDEFFWGSNCDLSATIHWDIWYDINTNSVIDSATDVLLSSEQLTDGNLLTDNNPVADGWVAAPPFLLTGEPGNYIFKATDVATDSSLQKIAVMVAMASPPNQFTGQITIPGVTAPNILLANKSVTAETDSGDEGIFLAFTDTLGQYSINVGAIGTGVEFFINASNIDDFVTPGSVAATASGVIPNIDFTYIAAVDSVWGFVKDELGTVLPYETDVSATSNNLEKYVTTHNGRYVIYFSNADKGNWNLEFDTQISPLYVSPEWLQFSHDTLTSFQHDFILTSTDTVIYVKVTENGGLPANNYSVNAWSDSLLSGAESVSGTSSNNVVAISISSLSPFWNISLNKYDQDYPIPTGFILVQDLVNFVSPGDTVSFNLVSGQLVSGTITQDPGDSPIDFNQVQITAFGSWPDINYDAIPDGSGTYSLYTNTGFYVLYVNADGYITNPGDRLITVSGDTTGAGLGFEINEAHCRVNGSLTNVALPLDLPNYTITARTATSALDGYEVTAQIDSVTGSYSMNLCDGTWTIHTPSISVNVIAPNDTTITIGESPDTVRNIDFVYSVNTGIEDGVGNSIPTSFALSQNYPNPFNPSTEISFALPSKSNVEIVVYNALGQKVNTLLNKEVAAGYHSVTWDGTNKAGKTVSSGMYLYQIIANDFVASKKMLLLK